MCTSLFFENHLKFKDRHQGNLCESKDLTSTCQKESLLDTTQGWSTWKPIKEGSLHQSHQSLSSLCRGSQRRIDGQKKAFDSFVDTGTWLSSNRNEGHFFFSS